MYRTVGVIGAAALGALALLLVVGARAPREVEAASLSVFSSADSGPGSFRGAVEAANANPSITKIVLRNWLPITLTSVVTYTGSQSLTVQGDSPFFNRVIQGSGDPCGLFDSDSAGDLTFSQVTLRGSSCFAIQVAPPSGATHEISVVLDKVVIGDVSTGLRMIEVPQSDLGWNLSMKRSRIDGCSQVGVTITESGPGGVQASFANSEVSDCGALGVSVSERQNGNVNVSFAASEVSDCGALGVSLQESQDGTLSFSANGSQFNGNGDEGLEVLEYDAGDLDVSLNGSVVHGNGRSGVSLFEAGAGHFELMGTFLQLGENGREGLNARESDGGDFRATLSGVQASGNLDNLSLNEGGEGDADFHVSGSTLHDSKRYGLRAVETDDGTLKLWMSGVTVNDNGLGGLRAVEAGEGNLGLTVLASRVESNDGDGVVGDEGADGSLTFLVSGSKAIGNTNGWSLTENDGGGLIGTVSATSSQMNSGHGYLLAEYDVGAFDVTFSVSSAAGNTGGGTFATADAELGHVHEILSALAPYDLTNVVVGP
ncbi:MAG: right-handed parallel beta-helix repeat-containing protein [Dehalococcoidia bacterium]